jgi:YggT family protein
VGIAGLVDAAFAIYLLMMLGRVITSWIDVDPDHPMVSFLREWTEPVLAPIRNVLPPLGVMDLSPLVALFLIMLVRRIVVGWILG